MPILETRNESGEAVKHREHDGHPVGGPQKSGPPGGAAGGGDPDPHQRPPDRGRAGL